MITLLAYIWGLAAIIAFTWFTLKLAYGDLIRDAARYLASKWKSSRKRNFEQGVLTGYKKTD